MVAMMVWLRGVEARGETAHGVAGDNTMTGHVVEVLSRAARGGTSF
ncbi:MAG: hypothetical protein WA733_21800 [Methylocystis sp.]